MATWVPRTPGPGPATDDARPSARERLAGVVGASQGRAPRDVVVRGSRVHRYLVKDANLPCHRQIGMRAIR
jgi:hypothetical protein